MMKHQSLMNEASSCQNDVDASIDDDNDEAEEVPKKHENLLDERLDDLCNESANCGINIKMLTEDLEFQKKQNAILKKRLAEYEAALKRSNNRVSWQGKELVQLAQTSEAVLQWVHSLQEDHKIERISHEITRRQTAKLKAEHTAAKRQSAALLTNISGDLKLVKALCDLEELTTKYELDKTKFENKISALEQELQDEKNKLGVQALEEETESLTKERDDLLQRLTDTEKLATEAQSQYSELQEKYAELEKKYEHSLNEPKIPAPPPLPPPLLPFSFVREGIKTRLTEGKRKPKESRLNEDMMKELKKELEKWGQMRRPLLKSRTQSEPEEKSAVLQLEGILNNMKKSKSEENLLAMDDDAFVDNETELQKTFKKFFQRKKGTDNTRSRPTPDANPRILPTVKDEDEEDKA